MPFASHVLRIGSREPFEGDNLAAEDFRHDVEPWLSSVCQTEHLSLLVGSGLGLAVAEKAGVRAVSMAPGRFPWHTADAFPEQAATELQQRIDDHAAATARIQGRGEANIEDQIGSALTLLGGLEVLQDQRSENVRQALNAQLSAFLRELVQSEQSLKAAFATPGPGAQAEALLRAFLLAFAARTPTRDRLSVFTLNYDRLIEYACDRAGVRYIDRFVGGLEPMFRSSRIDVDLHYNPPGIRGEPRYLEGVIRLGKLHGSLDWRARASGIHRVPLAFGAADNHPDLAGDPLHTVMVYPNPAKDVETFQYPYAELFRDFAFATCRPNSALITYGYGFGDDHVNRVIANMLSLSSTHVVIISYSDPGDRIHRFWTDVARPKQMSLLLGSHFGDLETIVSRYLPSPSIDRLLMRRTELLQRRGDEPPRTEAPERDANDNLD